VPFEINNLNARRLWLNVNALSGSPTGPLDLPALVRELGFVQLDTIQVVARAHHHILWSRNQNYREPMFDNLYNERHVFEHFTHDASIIPMGFLPMWKRQFQRKAQQIEQSSWFSNILDTKERAKIVARIRDEGALSTHAFDSKSNGSGKMWARPPHKQALDYMWYAGQLATCYRENFVKYYNIPERVFPKDLNGQSHDDNVQIDWLCQQAMNRLGIATAKEINRFWEAMEIKETREWVEGSDLVNVRVQSSDGNWTDAFAKSDIEHQITKLTTPNLRMRIINPFDPATRDRERLKRLFGFDYKIEMFVPAAKRKWGYYVYPILQGDQFIGRIEVKAERAKDKMTIHNLWVEGGVKWSKSRSEKLNTELDRMARFVGVTDIIWNCSVPD